MGVVLMVYPVMLRVARSMLSPAPKQFDRRDHSNTPASVHHSKARVAHRGRPHPNGSLSPHSSPVLTGPISPLRSERSLLPQDAADPRTAAPGGQKSAPRYCGLALSSPLPESAPKQRARAASCQGNAQEVAPLRKTPADNPVKSGTAATPSGARSSRHRTQRQTRSNLHSRV